MFGRALVEPKQELKSERRSVKQPNRPLAFDWMSWNTPKPT